MDDIIDKIEEYFNNKQNRKTENSSPQTESSSYPSHSVLSSTSTNQNTTESNTEKVSYSEKIINKLNSKQKPSILEVAKEYGVSPESINKLLSQKGYRYNTFIEQWTKLTVKEVLEEIINEINDNSTLYDVSGIYFSNKSKRINFVDKLEKYFKKEGYFYSNKKKVWMKAVGPVDHYVNDLNKGINMKDLAKRYNTTNAEIRLLLRKHRYRYERTFQIWTNKSERLLLLELIEDVNAKNTDLNEFLRSKELEFYDLIKKLEKYNIREKLIIPGTNDSIDFSANEKTNSLPDKKQESQIISPKNIMNDALNLTHKSSIEQKTTQTEVENTNINGNKTAFNKEDFSNQVNKLSLEEINKLKVIIKFHEDYISEKEKGKQEATFLLSNTTLQKLNSLADKKEINRSILLEEIITSYLKE
ncbi:hypothetical protein GCM10007216_03790 [Thalassobacillus devorans]|uniref:Uncharacterized protein n=1 Tax=Thalassobacillus devorans TaxID=279813 RepID=A0ABQ1NGQ9_9BACI|nr:hypothetical protein [Thalassobacillus devorans]NIK27287.1 Mor family transcriptional regulator [Thalassobacillus devorans]GGC76479.1 hypothetical protein GCM10007216_03790 [Thalassobacillus devorans]